jgi:SAM-dependent methyltransferase
MNIHTTIIEKDRLKMRTNKVKWTTTKKITLGKFSIPCSEDLWNQNNHAALIRRDSRLKLILKAILWPVVNLRNDILVDGFVKRAVGKYIREFLTEGMTFIEVGCGNMIMSKSLPKSTDFNGFDISLSEFHLQRTLKKTSDINIALASAISIPLESNSVSLIVSVETFEHISGINLAMDEIYRIATPNAKLICSIPNNYCYKYHQKGQHSEHVNKWTFDGFKGFMAAHKFRFLKGYMKGLWIPFPLWFTKTSYQLPISSNNEYYNTNFFYVFDVVK